MNKSSIRHRKISSAAMPHLATNISHNTQQRTDRLQGPPPLLQPACRVCCLTYYYAGK